MDCTFFFLKHFFLFSLDKNRIKNLIYNHSEKIFFPLLRIAKNKYNNVEFFYKKKNKQFNTIKETSKNGLKRRKNIFSSNLLKYNLEKKMNRDEGTSFFNKKKGLCLPINLETYISEKIFKKEEIKIKGETLEKIKKFIQKDMNIQRFYTNYNDSTTVFESSLKNKKNEFSLLIQSKFEEVENQSETSVVKKKNDEKIIIIMLKNLIKDLNAVFLRPS